MGAQIEVRGSPDLPLLANLTDIIDQVEPVFDGLAESSSIPHQQPTWIVCDEFENDVEELIREEVPDASFQADRLGGTVVGKLLNMPGDDRVVALNGKYLLDPSENWNSGDYLLIVAHELTHVLQAEARSMESILRVDDQDGHWIRRTWRSAVGHAADEYRADVLAAAVLGKIATSDHSDGTSRAASITDTVFLGNLGSAHEAIQSLHPKLPDIVDSYRTHTISLDELVMAVMKTTQQLLIVLGHASAICEELGMPEFLWENELVVSERATDLYVKPLWQPILQVLQEQPVLSPPADLAGHEEALKEVGEGSVEDFWKTLGLSVKELEDGDDFVQVQAPAR